MGKIVGGQNNKMINSIFNMYYEQQLGKNKICLDCKKIESEKNDFFSDPISIWHVGDKFEDEKNKILFIGKTARGKDIEGVLRNGIRDVTELANKLYKSSWAYWSYTREIVTQIFGDADNGWNNIAFTNAIKCNNSKTIDKTTIKMKDSCIRDLEILWREIEILKPNKIIFYTSWGLDDYIENYRIGVKYKDITTRGHKIVVGKKTIPWWERRFYDEDGQEIMRFLRTAHPERKKKIDFVNAVVGFIRSK